MADKVIGGAAPVPVPLSEMVCGELAELSVMVIAAVSAPSAVGAKCPWMVQLARTATLAPQLFPNTNDDALAPVTAMLAIDSLAFPLFVNVTNCDPLAAPTATEP